MSGSEKSNHPLLAAVAAATRRARDLGAIETIPTSRIMIRDGGLVFHVRQVARLLAKPSAVAGGQGWTNPFLPYDERLWVANVSPSHVCLLNKYNVVDHHALLITRHFEPQESPLTVGDFAAWWACLREGAWLGFYNGGQVAGASQPHKHMQIVPFPCSDDDARPTLADVYRDTALGGGGSASVSLPFRFVTTSLADLTSDEPAKAARELETRYQTLLEQAGVPPIEGPTRDRRSAIRLGPYNLLITRDWMTLVPRCHESFEGISVNAMGFAGWLLVRTESELERVRAAGPLRVLAAAGCP